ncbi:TlpA family protein disulfide reductase [Parasphingorhabdus sp. DH2-15]|uniref:TlpA family protein disulfide reductase n=1 Tax=Parasphingorhabdus sp. DH2-15 TaxID=3444112 RepID=UPI003F685477
MVSRFSSALPVLSIAAAALMLASCDTQSSDTGQDADVATNSESAVAADDGPPPHPAFSGKLDISKRGTAAPEAVFAAPDGSAVSLADFKGKPLLVNLWATWCAPCVAEMPTLDALAEKDDRLNVLVVSQDLEGNAKVLPFFEKAEFTKLKPYIDPENGLNFALATGIMPTTILYDSQGIEVWRMLGGMNWNGPRAAAMMEDTLAGS